MQTAEARRWLDKQGFEFAFPTQTKASWKRAAYDA
jgi:hypothetical protein